MKKKRLPALFLALTLALSLTAPAFAAIETQSYRSYYSVGGINYEAWTCLYQDSADVFRACTWVMNRAYTNLPDDYMGLSCEMYNANGDIYAKEQMRHNVGGIYFYSNLTSEARVKLGPVYASGTVCLYDKYTGQHVQYRMPVASSQCTATTSDAQRAYTDDVIKELSDTLTADGGYPSSKSGKTYGSIMLSSMVGETPDLISAVGEDGQEGYVLATDLYPEMNGRGDPGAYAAQLAHTKDARSDIPLYDLDENVIGSFHIQVPSEDEEIPPEIQRTINEIEARQAMPASSDGPHFNFDLMEVIPAKGTQGEDGYIHRSDFPGAHLRRNTMEEVRRYEEYMDTLPPYVPIPLYDENGEVIGSFHIGTGNKPVPEEEIQRQVGRPAASR